MYRKCWFRVLSIPGPPHAPPVEPAPTPRFNSSQYSGRKRMLAMVETAIASLPYTAAPGLLVEPCVTTVLSRKRTSGWTLASIAEIHRAARTVVARPASGSSRSSSRTYPNCSSGRISSWMLCLSLAPYGPSGSSTARARSLCPRARSTSASSRRPSTPSTPRSAAAASFNRPSQYSTRARPTLASSLPASRASAAS